MTMDLCIIRCIEHDTEWCEYKMVQALDCIRESDCSNMDERVLPDMFRDYLETHRDKCVQIGGC
jgi:hypothetical protein